MGVGVDLVGGGLRKFLFWKKSCCDCLECWFLLEVGILEGGLTKTLWIKVGPKLKH